MDIDLLGGKGVQIVGKQRTSTLTMTLLSTFLIRTSVVSHICVVTKGVQMKFFFSFLISSAKIP